MCSLGRSGYSHSHSAAPAALGEGAVVSICREDGLRASGEAAFGGQQRCIG